MLTATMPYVQRPHGMARIAPITTPGITDRYLADKIYGFPAGPATLMASVGKVGTDAETYASEFDHDFETATPYYYTADLQTWGIRAEFTATDQAVFYRFTFPASNHAHLAINLKSGAELEVVGNNAIQGSERFDGPIAKTRTFEPRNTAILLCGVLSPLRLLPDMARRQSGPDGKAGWRSHRVCYRLAFVGGRVD